MNQLSVVVYLQELICSIIFQLKAVKKQLPLTKMKDGFRTHDRRIQRPFLSHDLRFFSQQNGQHSDSTDRDVRVMKKRSFILCDLLKGCMQRLDYNVLTPYLQPKYEYVLCLCLSDLQKKLYTYYLDNYARAGQIGEEGQLEGGRRGGLFYDVQILSRIWNHPFILVKAKERADQKKMDDEDDEDMDEAGSLKDFVVDNSDDESTPPTTSNDDSDVQMVDEDDDGAPKVTKSLTRASRRKLGDEADVLVGGLDDAKRDAASKSRGSKPVSF